MGMASIMRKRLLIKFAIFLLIYLSLLGMCRSQEIINLTLYVREGGDYSEVLGGIKVTGWDAAGKSFNQVTKESGYVVLTGKPGLWHFRISGAEFVPRTWDAVINSSTVATNRSLSNPFFIEKINLPEIVTIYLYVESQANRPVLPGVRVTGWDSTGFRFNQITNEEGYVVLTGKPGLWNFTISKEEYENNSWEQHIIAYKDRKDAFFVKMKVPPIKGV